VVKAAGIYARISNDPEGDRLGVERQITDCRREAERRGWPVADLYVDDDKSAWSGRRRPEYERMLADIASHKLDAILFYHPDRLTRRPIEMEHFVEACLKAKVDEIAWIGGALIPSDSDGLLLLRIQAAVASDSSAKTSKRIRRQIEEAASKGLPRGGGYRPFGYRDDRLNIDPAEADLIRAAAERILAGDSLRSVVTDWSEAGVLSPAGKPWILPTFTTMIASGRLSGQREHKGEIVAKGVWEPILTPEQTTAIRAILDANRHARRRPTRRYFLTGILHCGRCGAPLIARPDARSQRRYVCAKGVGYTGCGGLAVMAEPVEAFIEEALLQRIDRREVASALAGAAGAEATRAADRDAIVADEAELEELARDYAERRITRREWLAARDIIEARIEEARRRISRESATAALDPYLGRPGALREEWTTIGLNRQRSIATALLNRATIRPAAVPGRGVFDPARIEPLWRL